MKEYSANYAYRGRYFDFRFCAKSNKEAAKILGCSAYHVSNYYTHQKIDNPYPEIYVIPHCYKAKKDIGHNKEMLFEDAKNKIDKVAEKWNKKFNNNRLRILNDTRILNKTIC
jgi:hypothetical protein